MHLPSLHNNHNPDPHTLPTVTESHTQTSIMDKEKRKDSATVPRPTRNPSTRIQEPTRHPSTRTTTTKADRPPLQRRRTTARTRYIDMLLALDSVPPTHNILAAASVWILLAGYIVFPATFNSLKNQKFDDKASSSLEKSALNTVRNVPLLYVAAFACGLGVLGCVWLWWCHRKNYVWVVNRIFIPAAGNSVAGLISTIVNVYSAQGGQYSVTAKVTVVVTAACSVVAIALFLLYNMVMLKLVKRKHEREIRDVERLNDDDELVLQREQGVYTSRAVR